MPVETIVVGPIQTNCYLLNKQQDCLIIDPGAEAEKIISVINDKKLKPVAIINTHGHYDHVLANGAIKKKYNIPIYYPKDDLYLIDIQKSLYSVIDFPLDHSYERDISIPGFSIRVIPTPGHTEGSCCILIDDLLFSGDMLFAEGYLGRTDLWGGSAEKIKKSLARLLELPDNIKVYPGHGPVTTIGAERKLHGK